MLRRVNLVACISAILAVVATSAVGDTSYADPLSSVAPPQGMIEELLLSGPAWFEPMALGPEDTVWFPQESLTGTEQTIERITLAGEINGEFTVPLTGYYQVVGLSLGLGGGMWFTLNDPNYIGRVSSGGKFSVFQLSSAFGQPTEIAMGSDGGMWFTSLYSDKIGRIDEVGNTTEYPIPSGTQPNLPEYSMPTGIALGADGNMWFTDRGVNREGRNLIGRITPQGTISEFAIPAYGSSPAGIALGADGDMWFGEPGVSRIGRITPEGVVSEFEVPSASGPIVLGADGNMWFTEGIGANAIGRITPAGVVTSFAPVVPNNYVLGNYYPTKLIAGSDGDLWFVGAHIERLKIPLAPVNSGLPAISGAPVQGQELSASVGAWSYDPSAFDYQWQLCGSDGEACVDIGGEVAATHVLTAADVGHRLRVVVEAGNIGGATSAVSEASGVVVSPPPSPPGEALVVKQPLPVVSAKMTWSFGWSKTYTIVEALELHDLPLGGDVEVACAGRGCGFTHRRWTTAARAPSCKGRKCARTRPAVLHGNASLTSLFKGRHLKVGTRVLVTVQKPGWIGKSFVFTMRANKSPHIQVNCLGSGTDRLTGEC